jgi:hypothetical protein
MKRSIQALVLPTSRRAVSAIAAAALVLAAAASLAHAVSPVAKLTGSASLTQLSTTGSAATAARFHVRSTFSTDTPGAQPFTVQKATIFFPDHSGTNGRLFKSCSAAQIERSHGNVHSCPKGSLIVTATGRVTMFNSHHGKSITFNIQTLLPAYINKSLDAPIEQLHGRYGEKLTLAVPHSLQEILEGVFVGVRTFDVTISGSVVVHGTRFSFLKARTCPTQALHGVFEFENWTTEQTATATADAKVRCTSG